ncbi:MAG TPA: DUF3574 domain-containing protein [Hyphomicrobiaceae bacterium]|jgi:hypothetical protein|nr:DUF3574 domain-containing protein [Hyphomicrobiaceae bacterium]
MTENARLLLAALGGLAIGAGTLTAWRAVPPGEGASTCRPGTAQMARFELLFGTGRKGAAAVGEVEWQGFLDGEVTPRFPDGLTVLTGYGQWRSGDGLRKEGSRLLLIWVARATANEAKIEAIRTAYKARFAQESVLRADGLSCVSF